MASTAQTTQVNWGPSPEAVQGFSKLRIPEHTGFQEDSFLLDVGETEAWISSLPVANVSKTARLVFETLVEFNRQAIPDPIRIKTAELFRQPVSYINGNFEKHCIDAAFPLSKRSHKTVELNRELHSELAISYKIFIQSALISRKRISKKLLATANHRAMCCLSDILLLSSLAYEPPPPNTWQEIHYLYALAAKNGVHKLPIEDPIEKPANRNPPNKTSIDDLYKRILLYALVSPCYLRQRENRFLYHELLEWTDYAGLSIPDVQSRNREQFIARLSSDEPPYHISLETKKLNAHCRLLDTGKLVQHLQEMLEAAAPQQQKSKPSDCVQLSESLLKHLISHWSSRPKRRYTRTKLHFSLKLAVGIPTVHTLVKARGEKSPAAVAAGLGDMDWLGRHIPYNYAVRLDPNSDWDDSSAIVLDPDSEDTEASRHFPACTLEDNVHAPWAARPTPQNSAGIYECKTSNESAGGYCVDWQNAGMPKIKPGELIGIQSTTDYRQFGIGATRWIKNTQGQKLQLGMQLIAPNAFAVRTRLETNDCDTVPFIYQCLLVPEAKAMDAPLSLIAPANSYQEGDIIWINGGHSERRICLTRLLESTAAFAQYQITYHS